MNSDSDKKSLIEMEKGFLEAYKNKDSEAFKKNFADDYVGVANDGMQTVEKEIKKMSHFDVENIEMQDEKVVFPAENVAVLTYKMVSTGTFDGKKISGSIYASTVYLNRDDEWQAVLHTESMEQK